MKAIKYIFTGLGFGFLCTTLTMASIMGLNDITVQTLAWMIASGFYGLVSIIFENEKLSMLVKNIIHYALCLLVTLVLIIMFYKEYMLIVFISFTIMYIIINLIMTHFVKKDIEEMNKKLASR